MPDDAIRATNPAGGLSGGDLRILTRIWQHPLTPMLALRDVTALFAAIGSAQYQHNGEFRLRIGNDTLSLHRPPGRDLTSDEVVRVRHFLDRNGWSPTATRVADVAVTPADMVIVIDHDGARVYRLGGADDPHHILHDIDRKQHVSDREETLSTDQRFFADIAGALAPAGRIVVIGHGHRQGDDHGHGQGDAAPHLVAWADIHRPDIHARIARAILADLPHMTTDAVLALARHALATP